MMKRITTAILIISLSALFVLPVFANDETTMAGSNVETTTASADSGSANAETTAASGNSTNGVTEIYDYEGLLKIKDNPSGSYKLMADIDMKGKAWKPIDFTGTFDGGGHAILNAEITEINDQCRTTKDGNMLKYDTYFSGLFGTLDKATIKDLNLLGVNVKVETNTTNIFIGAIAGFMEETTISGCSVQGTLSLSTSSACFGVGGIIGFGNGSIENCSADVTLICVDNDREHKDEQFMGGAYAVGYTDLINDTINVNGYVSEHGYSHNGGLIGMYILYYEAIEYAGTISYNTVTGQITFYEDNDDPRAYCEPYVGEVMNWTFEYDGNQEAFTSNNVTEEFREEGFVTVLQPHYCENPTYNDSIVPSTCASYGYTEHICAVCGAYSYRSDYQPLGHTVSEWTVQKEATATENGVEKGTCKDCQAEVFRSVSLAAPAGETTTQASGDLPAVTTGTTEPQNAENGKISTLGIILIIIAVIVVGGLVAWLIANYRKEQKKKKRRAARRAAAQGRRPDGYRNDIGQYRDSSERYRDSRDRYRDDGERYRGSRYEYKNDREQNGNSKDKYWDEKSDRENQDGYRDSRDGYRNDRDRNRYRD